MTPQQLKASVLQMAIEGKLVPQLDDEPAVEIDAVEPEEVPFAIPEKWKWCTINDIVTKLTDGEHKTPKYQAEGIPFVSVKNISSGKLTLRDTKYIKEEDYKLFIKRCFPQKGDILLSKVGTTGVPVIVDTDNPFALFVSVALLKLKDNLIYNKFAYFLLQSPLVQVQAKENTRGVGNKNWVLSAIGGTLIALPPIAEQYRIVAQLEELLPCIEEYSKAHSILQNMEKSLPDQLRASLLQEAIQGKLVPQLDDEPAVEIDAAEPEEVPFAIPEKWRWVRLKDLVVPCKQKVPDKNFYYIDVASINNKKYKLGAPTLLSPDKAPSRARKIVKKGMVLYSTVRPYLLNTCILDEDFQEEVICSTAFAAVACKPFLQNKYLLMVLTGPYFSQYVKDVQKGVAYPAITDKQFYSSIIPLPPLAEQRRIVARLEELLPHVRLLQ